MRAASDSPGWVDQLDEWHLLTPGRVILVVLLAVIATLVIRHVVSKSMRRVLARTLPGDPARAEARYHAITSALLGAIVGAIWTIAVITIISELGINIGAFVATATIIGGALAFGAQTMVRDVIAGFFVLVDDQFGVGDQVDLGHASGVVERVTLRGTRVRDGQGGVWYVSHGNVMRVGNLSKTSTAWLDVEVARTMTVDATSRVAAELAQSLVDDEHIAPLLLSTPVEVGVVDVRDDRIVFRTSVATHPGQQEPVKRAWRARALGAFERGDLVAPPTAVMP